MSMTLFKRKLSAITFAENQVRTLELPRNYAMRHLSLWLDAVVTLAGGSAGNPKDSCPAQLIKRIEVVRDGSETIKSIDFETLHRLTHMRYGTRPKIDSLPAGFADIASEPVEVHARLDFAMPKAFRPIDTMLDASRATTLSLIVTFGAAADIMDDDYDGTVTVNSAQLNVSTCEMMNVPADLVFNDFKERPIQQQVSAASSNLQVDIPVGNYYRGFLIKTSRNGVPSNSILNEMTLKSGTKIFALLNAEQLQFDNRLDAELETPVANDTVNRKYLEQVLDGYYYLDLASDGRLMESLATRGMSSLEFEFDVNNPGSNTDYINIFPEEIVLAAVK